MNLPLTTTPRLLLRPLELDDLESLVPILSDPLVMEYSASGPLSKEKIQVWLTDMIAEYELPGFSVWAVILKDENKLIGFCGIRPVDLDGRTEIELIFRFAQTYWGQGYATEASHGAIEYAFNSLAINNVIAIVDPRNTRSLNVLQKLHMHYEKDSIYKEFPVRVYRLNKFHRP